MQLNYESPDYIGLPKNCIIRDGDVDHLRLVLLLSQISQEAIKGVL